MWWMVLQYQKLENDPLYTSCNKSTCQDSVGGHCVTTTCSGSLTFRLINIRTDITFVFFTGGFLVPCVLNTSATLPFANPKSPLYGHLSSVDSTATQVCVFMCNCILAKIEHANRGICMHVRWLISLRKTANWVSNCCRSTYRSLWGIGNPKSPLYGHRSFVDSTATTW